MSLQFTITAKDPATKARTGRLTLTHGTIETPAFIPVGTKAAVKAMTTAQLKELNVPMLMVNTYHCYLRPGPGTVARAGGLHKFMAWDRPIMTDSGGFQAFSLSNIKDQPLAKVTDAGVTFRSHIDHSEHTFTPESSIATQEQLGADLIFAFDECLAIDAPYEDTRRSLARTHAWAKRSFDAHKRKDQALYGIVQGGRYKDLRIESAKFISSIPFPGYGIGSLFGEPKAESAEVLSWAMEQLPYDKPKHLLGIGAVDDIFEGVAQGIDTFDCVLPTRLARVGYLFSTACTEKDKWRYRITNVKYRESQAPLDPTCTCYVCKNFTQSYIHHLFRADELLAYTLASYHNIAFFMQLFENIRASIRNGTFQVLRAHWHRTE